MTAAAISATSTARPCRNSSSSNWNWPSFGAIDIAIARVITDAITDDGYLNDALEDIRLSLLPEIEASAADVERVLGIVAIAGTRRRRCAHLGRVHCTAVAPA